MTALVLRLVALAVTLLLLPTLLVTVPASTARGSVAPAAASAAASARPDIVVVLVDDMSVNLLRTMRIGRDLRGRGAVFSDAYAVDSLCCVSRSSIFTGQYPHQTGVLLNTHNLPNPVGPLGGWRAFRQHGNGPRQFAVQLRRSGYRTGFLGKFLNQYEPVHRDGRRVAPVRPEGWTEWQPFFADAYNGWGFTLVGRDGGLKHVSQPPAGATAAEKDRRYATTVMANLAVDFIRRRRAARAPYFLTVAPFAPHQRTGSPAYRGDPFFPPAFRDRPSAKLPGGNCGRVRCGSLGVDDLVGYGDRLRDNRPFFRDGRRAPSWRPASTRLTRAAAVGHLRNRARMLQAVDRMIGRILREVGPNTFVLLTSDNGFHLGQHGLGVGKGAPYRSDSQVPLVVAGPGVEPGRRGELVNNVDLAATIESLARVRTPRYRFGRSFAPSLFDAGVESQRYAFFEHTWAPSLGGNDPDRNFAGGTMDRIPSYVAVRDRHGLLVRLDLDNHWRRTRFAWEYYDYRDDPFERVNTVDRPSKAEDVRRLSRALREFLSCHDRRRGEAVGSDCRAVTR